MYRSPLLNKAIIPALSVLALGYAVYATGVMQPRKDVREPIVQPPTRRLANSLAATGVVEPASELVTLSPRVGGWIETVHVRVGDRVVAGDKLVTLDSLDLQAELVVREQAVGLAEAKLARLRALPRPEDVPVMQAAVDEARAALVDAERKLGFVESVSDRRAVSAEEVSHRRQTVARARAALAARQAELGRLDAGAWKPDIAIAEQERHVAVAALHRLQADIARLTTNAPTDATVLQCTARPGQYASVGDTVPMMVLGSVGPLHVRADVNEQDIPLLQRGASAIALVRGNTADPVRLRFVRIEPLIVPKRALSGFAPERVDTRVLQVIFAVEASPVELFSGQQVDIEIAKNGQ